MTRILLVGDIHVSDRPPSSCTEGYTDDIIAMLTYIAELEISLKADAVVWAGDIFNHKTPGKNSHALIIKMINVVKLYKNLKIVIGNHDISNDVAQSAYEKQPLGVLFAAGAEELNGWDRHLPLYGVPWQQRWLHEDTPAEAFAAFKGQDNAALSLAVTHAPIYPPINRDDQLFELVPTAGEHGLSEAMGNEGYLYYGHIHEDHGVFTDEGVTYANMGAISRGSLHEYNRERQIKIALWTDGVDAGDTLGFTEVPIPHRPAAEVFKLTEAAAIRDTKVSLDKFLSEVGSSTLNISSTESVIAHIKSMEAPVKVKKTSIEILEEMA